MQADLLQRPLVIGAVPDATALGVAQLAAPAGAAPARHTSGIPAGRGAATGAAVGEATDAADIIVTPRIGRRAARALSRAWERAVYGRPAGGAR
jgi:hypothetical protein